MIGGAFIVTTCDWLPGARLSRVGSFGNMPFASVEQAEAAARAQGGAGVAISHERGRRTRG